MKRYFIPRNSRIYSTVAHMKPLMRYLFTIALLTSVTGTWYYVIYNPIQKKLLAHEHMLHNKYEQVEILRVSNERKECLQKACAHLHNTNSIERNLLSHESCLNHLLSIVESLPATMRLISYSSQEPSSKTLFTSCPVHIIIEGSLDAYAQWLHILATSPFVVRCSRCTISSSQEKRFAFDVDLTYYLFNANIKRPSNLE